jgi:WD40 repeat protein/predicted ATPase/DNA-binding SARP family transcriptional activator
MTTRALTLLGALELTRDGAPVSRFHSDKVRALLAYLATESDRPHARASLAALLWPEQTDAAALRNLSQTLVRLREVLGHSDDDPAPLQVTWQAIQWLPDAATVDVGQFTRLARSANPDDLARAAVLYRGEFLAGFALPGCEAFEEWLLLTREQFQQQALAALHSLAEQHLAARRWQEAAAAAQRQIELDRWREDAYRQQMRALVGGGDRAAALAVYQRCAQVLHDDLAIAPDDETAALGAAIRAGESAGPEGPVLRHTPPAPLISLVGRAADVAAVRQLLRQAEVRLLTFTGPGGVGKTGLALQVAFELSGGDAAEPFADGVCFVNLAAISDPDLVATTIAQALAIRVSGDTSVLDRLKEHLQHRQTLLVLDNFEQLLAAAPLVAELLTSCGGLKLLVTSRAALRLRGERVFSVPALSLPALEPLPELEALAGCSSVSLFIQRAQAALPTFQLNAANAAAVAEICVRLDGLPLALELAAARVRLLTPQDLLARLSGLGGDSPRWLLGSGARDAPVRQQTLWQTIEWSYQLLDADLQALFARLGVFVGGCTMEAAEAVALVNVATFDHGHGLDGLAALIDQSMLQSELGPDDVPRFRMLATIREYALAQLQQQGEADRLWRQHAAYYLALAEAYEPLIQGADQARWLDRLEGEHDNLRAALGWALAHGASLGLRLAAALGEFWWPRGHLHEGRRWLARLLERGAGSETVRAKALYRAGELAYGQGDPTSAIALLEEALALYRRLDDRRGTACVLRGLGNASMLIGNPQEAASFRTESLALFRQVGDSWGIAWMLLEIGRTESDLAAQATMLQESLELARAGGYKRTIATALGNLGKLARARGDYTQAGQRFQETLAIGRELRDSWIVAWTLSELALLAIDQRDDPLAVSLFRESIALFRQGGNKSGAAFGLDHLGDIMRRQGDHVAATRHYEESLALNRELGDAPSCDLLLHKLAQLARPAPLSIPAPSRPDWDEAPHITTLYGRQGELAQLERWLLRDPCRLVAVVGIGGVGKTMLAAAAAKAAAPHFEVVIWHSLLNAPPLDELLREILQQLADRHRVDLPNSLDALLALLLDDLRRRRCLLVLDNLESVLDAGRPGQMRPGYDDYARLIQRVAEHRHRSCLLLTSREQPNTHAFWEGHLPLVKLLLLGGLDRAAGQELLAARGLPESAGEAAALVERYSGNPLALKLVSQVVQDLFGNDIVAFLNAAAPIFDDIRVVLDQQFARLTTLEQEILIWLAIEREPIPMHALRDSLVDPGSPRAFLEALRGLRRRSLVEQHAQGCVLQNVVIEYLTDVLVNQVCREITGDADTPSIADQAPLRLASSALNRYALLKATAKEFLRASQTRLIVEPLAQRLLASLGVGLAEQVRRILAGLQATSAGAPGYAAGNILNLLLHLQVDLRGYDFSRLTVRQAYLQGVRLPEVSFRDADLSHSVFTHVFGEILTLRFDGDQQLLVAGIAEGRLCLWRADGRQLRDCQILASDATIAAFSHDGRIVITGDTDHQVRLWDVAYGRLLHTLSGHAETPWALACSPDGAMLASSGADGVIFLWDMQTGRLLHTLRAHSSSVPTLAFTPDGQLLSSGDIEGTICVWRVGAPEPLHTLHSHSDEVHVLLFDASGSTLASGSHDRTIGLWDVQRGQLVHRLRAHGEVIRAMAISPDGSTLASGGGDTFVCLWDVRSGQALHTLLELPHRISCLSFSPNGRTLAVVGGDQAVSLWDVASGRRLNVLRVFRHEISAIDFSPDGKLLAGGGTDTLVRLWDVAMSPGTGESARPARTLHGHGSWVFSVACSPDGTLVASAGRTIRLWDLRSGGAIRSLRGHSDDVEAIQFSPDGRRLISASRDTTLRLWDVSSGQTIEILRGHTERVLSCAFSPDGRLVASGSIDRTVRLWDVGDGAGARIVYMLYGHTNGIRCVAFNGDGSILASGGFDQLICLWGTRHGELLCTLPAQDAITSSIAFHPGGTLLVTGAKDHAVRLWEIRAEATADLPRRWSPGAVQLRSILRGHTNSVEEVCISPDGRSVASCSTDGTIKIWDIATGTCRCTLRTDGPYAGMIISGATGISPAQKAALTALGALEA